MSGVVFTPAAADRIGRATRWVEAQRQAGREPAGPARGVEPVWARVTSGTADGDGYYPGVITLRAGDDGSWSDYSAVKVGPLNGETLTNAARYAVRPSGRTSAGDELYTVIGATVAAGAITVKEVDGSPNYSGITTLRLDRETGIIANAVSDGVNAWVMGIEASPTQWGMMTPNAQSFAGAKYFGQAITSNEDFVRSMTPNTQTGVFGADLSGAYVEYTDSAGDVMRLDIVGGSSYDFEFYTDQTAAPGLSLVWTGGSANGQTGTSGGGDTVTSGLITALGSGPSTIDGGTW